MKLAGLQKLTLLDYPGRTACTVFLPGCNLRCPFCHNSQLIGEAGALEEEELFALLEKRRGILDGVCVTGGEPLLHPDTPALLRRIKAAGYAVKLDTNGFFPDALAAVLTEGLADYVAMDIKASPARYARACGLPAVDVAPVARSAALLRESGLDYELRTTVVCQLHAPGDFAEIGRWLAGAPRYFLQAFVDSAQVPFAGLTAPDRAYLEQCRQNALPYLPNTQLRGV